MKSVPNNEGGVASLSVNGTPVPCLYFDIDGPVDDKHRGYTRKLSGHDGDYIRTSSLKRGDTVFNWRNWSGISAEELCEVEREIEVDIPQGCLLENLMVTGIPHFSKLPPTTRLVFPVRNGQQLILAVWEENGPCRTVAERLAEHHGNHELIGRFIQAARDKRGVMGLVLSAGQAVIGDDILVYLPT